MPQKSPVKEKFKALRKGTTKITRPISSRILYLVMALITVAFLVGGYVFYNFQEQQMRQRIEGGLSTVTQLKADQIAQWRAERLVDAGMLMGSPFFPEGVEEYMASPADTEVKDKVLARLAVLDEAYPYQDILLTDVNGDVLLSLNESVNRLSDMTSAQLAIAIEEHKAVMTDFHYASDVNSPYLDVIAPLFPWGADSQQAVGAVVLCINPAQYLWPLVQSWPIPSETTETLLVERDGDQVLFLNDLRYQKDTALKLRIPLSQQEDPAVMAVLGKEEVVEGKDYRGVEVLAALKHIPDSPWYMVSKIDTSEVLSAWLFRAGVIIAYVAALLATSLAATGLIWQRRQRLAYQALYEAEVESQALRRHFEYLVKYANDIIILADEDHHIIEANDRALETYGYTLAEILGLPLAALVPPGGFSSYQERLRKIQKGATVAEAIHQRKDGSTFPVEVSGRVIRIENKPYIQEIIRDITERKMAEEALAEEAAQRRILMDKSRDGIVVLDLDAKVVEANQRFAEMLGYTPEEVREFHTWDWDVQWTREELLEKGRGVDETGALLETRHRRKDGTVFDVDISVNSVVVAGQKLVFCVCRDVTERKRAEEALRISEQNFRDSIENSPLGIRVLDSDGKKTIYANRALLDMWGYGSIEELEAVPAKRRYTLDTYTAHMERLKKRRRGEPAPLNYEVSIVRSDGQVRILSASRGELLWGGEKMFQVVYQDVTEHRRAEEALHISEQNFRDSIENSPLGIRIVSEDGKTIYANRAFLGMCGYGSLEELQAVPRKQRFTPQSYDEHRIRVEKRERGEHVPSNYEMSMVRSDGQVRILSVSRGEVLWNGEKKFQVVHQDITERKQAEEALRQSEEKYRTILKEMGDAYFEVDLAGNVIFANDSMCRYLGYSIEELLGMNYRSFTAKEDIERVYRVYNEVYRTGKPNRGYNNKTVRKDGSIGVVDFKVSPSRSQGGEIIGFQGVGRDITERKQAEEALAKSEEKYRTILNEMEDGYFEVNLAGNLTFVNDSTCRSLGYSVEELLGMNYRRFTAEDSIEDVYQAFNEVYKTGEPNKGFFWKIIRKDGSIGFADTAVSLLRGHGGEIIGFRGLGRDVTERRMAEEALAKSEEKYRTVLEGMGESYYETDLDGNFAFFNDALCRQMRYSREELMGMNYKVYTPPEHVKRVFKIYTEVYRTGEPVHVDMEEIRKDGTRLFVENSVLPLRNEMGEIIGFRGLGRDVTERKRTEEALRESEARHRTLFETMAQGVVYQNAKGLIISANPAAERILGLTLNQMMGRTSVDPRWEAIHEDGSDFPGDTHPAMVALKTCKPVRNVVMGVFHPGFNKHVWININAIPQFLAGESKPYQVYTTFEDITGLKLAAEELEKAVEELQRSNAELERFAYVASHDLQEPLRMVSSYTQLLERRYKDKLDADANDFINYAVDGAERMQQLLNDLLIYSRVGTRAKPFKRTDMEEVLQAALANLQVTIKESKARVIHDPLPTVMADEGQMVQVLQNLISNAVKFRGERSPRIRVSAERRDSEWVFSVKDNGIGIESQYFDRVFLVFQRLHRDEYPGTGTGLAIAKRIVERHGGRMWIESQPGKGSTFYFSIKATGNRNEARTTRDERQVKGGKR
jgi:PAS domain S-box-containing protein